MLFVFFYCSEFADDDVHLRALLSRIHFIEMRTPVYESVPSEEELKTLPGKKFILRPRIFITGLAMLGLFQKYFPNGIDEYSGETIQGNPCDISADI